MKRLLVFVVLASMVHAPVAFAGESLLESASRVARQTAASMAVTDRNSGGQAQRAATAPLAAAALPGQAGAPVLAQQGPGLASSGMGKGKKFLIALAAAVGFAVTAYTIDHKVEDNTPSSHGLREDL